MNCRDFWTHYEESGMTAELETHLLLCPDCRKELDTEKALMEVVHHLPVHTAPGYLWDRIAGELPEESPKPVRGGFASGLSGRIRSFLNPGVSIRLKPVLIGFAIMVTSVLATRYYYTNNRLTGNEDNFQVDSLRNLDEIEHEYLEAIETLSMKVESSKESIDPELYDLYSEKLAILDEYIQQCREALDANEYNPNARKYLALAYREKMDTLKEMAKNI